MFLRFSTDVTNNIIYIKLKYYLYYKYYVYSNNVKKLAEIRHIVSFRRNWMCHPGYHQFSFVSLEKENSVSVS